MGMFLRRGPAPRRTRMSDLEIGQTIKLNVNGKAWDWLVVQQGLPSDIYDASCDGTWLLMKDIYEKRQWNNYRDNYYRTSTITAYLNGDFFALFDGNIKDAIKQIKIPWSAGTGASGLSVKIFLLSYPEVGITSTNGTNMTDGAKLSFFETGFESSANNKRIAKLNGSADFWFLRSTDSTTSTDVGAINTSGGRRNADPTTSWGIRPALVLPSDFIVSEEMLAA